MNLNLYTLFESRFPADRSRTMFEMPGSSDYSFADVENISARFAHLLANTGAKPGDRVAVQIHKSAQAVFLYLACLRAGLVYLPLNTAYQAAEVEYFLSDSAPAVVVCDPGNVAKISELASAAGVSSVFTLDGKGRGSLMEKSASLADRFETEPRANDDLAAILYTSGTTGRSKGAMLSHGNLASNAKTLHSIWGFEPGDVLLHALPIFHVHGLFVALHCAFLNGSRIIFLDKFDPDTVIANLPRSTVFMGVPTFYARLLANPGFDSVTCRNMRLFTAGSAPLLEETFNEFSRRSGHVILERYGMTECGMITSNPYDGARIAGSVGPKLPDNEVRIADEDGNILQIGEIGILETRGPNVFRGYWQMPEKTAAEFREDGFFITGDMALQEKNGYFKIVGRSKDLIISGGYNVYPKEIESYLDEMDGVLESAVVGRAHADFGEVAVAYIVRDETDTDINEEDVMGFVKSRLANFKVPKSVYFLDQLPRNTMGKVQKNILRENI